MFLRVSILAAVVLGVGCVGVDVDQPQTRNIQQNFQVCEEWLCGTNSPQIAEFGFWELNLPPALGTPGLPNNAGMQLLRFVQGGIDYRPSVFRGRLTGSRVSPVPPFHTITLSGGGLVGGTLVLGNHGREFHIRITEVGVVDSWAQLPSLGHVVLESYKLDWTEVANGAEGRFQNVCSHPPSRDNGDALTMNGSLAFHTLLFEGDRIDAAKKLDTGIDTSWFNLGCAGSALAKLALTGHTEAAINANTFSTKLYERQAMLKMLAADYCGDGTPFTVAGQPLNWHDDRGTMKLSPVPLALEARWTENGAACLDKPRVDVHPTVLSDQVFGPTDIYSQVQAYCPFRMPPPCVDSSLNLDGYHLLSATPL